MKKRASEFGSRPLAVMITGVYMPEAPVSKSTDRTRAIGAYSLLLHLMEGDWGDSVYCHNYEELLAEFMRRVTENAQRQGISLSE